MTDEEMKEKVIKHDYEFQSLTKSLTAIVKELNEITASMKSVAVINKTIENMDRNLKESFTRVYGKIEQNEEDIKDIQHTQNTRGCSALNIKSTEIDTLNRAVFGKDGRGGIVFDVEDLKRFMYKVMGAFTFLNVVIALLFALLKQ